MFKYSLKPAKASVDLSHPYRKLEIAVDNVESAVMASENGADSIELCSGLLLGGVTPSPGIYKRVRERVRCPVYAVIKPRNGDFCYNEVEIEIMKKDILEAKARGVDGLVFGVLKNDDTIDKEACYQLMKHVGLSPVTFPRAFDLTPNPVEALETIIGLGFTRVITSGHRSEAIDGLAEIKRLVARAGIRIRVMPGGGITSRNIKQILHESKATEFQSTGQDPSDYAILHHHHDYYDCEHTVSYTAKLAVADQNEVREIGRIIKGIKPRVYEYSAPFYDCQ